MTTSVKDAIASAAAAMLKLNDSVGNTPPPGVGPAAAMAAGTGGMAGGITATSYLVVTPPTGTTPAATAAMYFPYTELNFKSTANPAQRFYSPSSLLAKIIEPPKLTSNKSADVLAVMQRKFTDYRTDIGVINTALGSLTDEAADMKAALVKYRTFISQLGTDAGKQTEIETKLKTKFGLLTNPSIDTFTNIIREQLQIIFKDSILAGIAAEKAYFDTLCPTQAKVEQLKAQKTAFRTAIGVSNAKLADAVAQLYPAPVAGQPAPAVTKSNIMAYIKTAADNLGLEHTTLLGDLITFMEGVKTAINAGRALTPLQTQARNELITAAAPAVPVTDAASAKAYLVKFLKGMDLNGDLAEEVTANAAIQKIIKDAFVDDINTTQLTADNAESVLVTRMRGIKAITPAGLQIPQATLDGLDAPRAGQLIAILRNDVLVKKIIDAAAAVREATTIAAIADNAALVAPGALVDAPLAPGAAGTPGAPAAYPYTYDGTAYNDQAAYTAAHPALVARHARYIAALDTFRTDAVNAATRATVPAGAPPAGNLVAPFITALHTLTQAAVDPTAQAIIDAVATAKQKITAAKQVQFSQYGGRRRARYYTRKGRGQRRRRHTTRKQV